MTALVWTLADEYVHREGISKGGPSDRKVTGCGWKVFGRLAADPEGERCPTCFAHPMAEVWDQCRRWDDQYAAFIGARP